MLPHDISPEQIVATFVKRVYGTGITPLAKHSAIFHFVFPMRFGIHRRGERRNEQRKRIKNIAVSHRADEALDLFQKRHIAGHKKNNNVISETSVAQRRFFIVRLNRLGGSVSYVPEICVRSSRSSTHQHALIDSILEKS